MHTWICQENYLEGTPGERDTLKSLGWEENSLSNAYSFVLLEF